jgi:hypothetical protein
VRYEVPADKIVGVALDQRSRAEQFASRRAEPDKVRAVASPGLESLGYLVFDRKKLVAAFAMHDDAEQWIGEFGNRDMKLQEKGTPRPPVTAKRRANIARGKRGGVVVPRS